jgi:fatty acid desaturase
MGEAKRRKEILGEDYGKQERILPWVPIRKGQADQFVKLSTRGAWIGIIFLVVYWVTIRFIGPSFGWWQVD